MSQRVKNPEEWTADLEREPGKTAASAPTEAELRKDETNFLAFAAAVGVAPPSRQGASA